MTTPYPYQLRLPLAPYRFVWRDEAAVDAEKDATDAYTQERYVHADGTSTVIREYRADGSYHIMSDRGADGGRGPRGTGQGRGTQAGDRLAL